MELKHDPRGMVMDEECRSERKELWTEVPALPVPPSGICSKAFKLLGLEIPHL